MLIFRELLFPLLLSTVIALQSGGLFVLVLFHLRMPTIRYLETGVRSESTVE